MFKSLSLICIPIFVLVYTSSSFAEVMSYEAYSTGATDFCDGKQPWNDTSRVVGKIPYPELKSDTVNAWMSSQITSETSKLGRAKLQEALDPERIGNFAGWRALEVTQSAYNARMNTLFDCAVIESRISIIKGLQEAKAINSRSEIVKKLEKEMTKLTQQQGQCLPDEKGNATGEKGKSTTPPVKSSLVTSRMVNSVVLQNCHYTKYLTYLESRIDGDISNTLTIDTQIGTGDAKEIPTNTDTMRRILGERREQIRIEIALAQRTLPRAILAYQEMARTYAAHLMLVIVYDDYVRLRDNLAKYTSATSQLFEKAYNAMTP